MITITKEFTFDMAHRLPNHEGKCKNLHGHTYKMHLTFMGDLNKVKGDSSEGMLIDFKDLKAIANEFIDKTMDHYCMVYKDDTALKDFLMRNGFATTIVPFIPTAENMCKWVFEQLEPKYSEIMLKKDWWETGDHIPRLISVKIWETPTSFAEYTSLNLSTFNK